MSIPRTTAHLRAIPPLSGFHKTLPFAVRHLHASTTRLATQQDHYDVLGLTQSSSKRDIKNKYYEVSLFSQHVHRSEAMAGAVAILSELLRGIHTNEKFSSSSYRRKVIRIEKAVIEPHSKR